MNKKNTNKDIWDKITLVFSSDQNLFTTVDIFHNKQ